MKEKLFGKTLEDLQQIVVDEGLPKFTAKQIAHWLYQKNIQSIADMRNLSKQSQATLQKKYEPGLVKPCAVQTAADATKKYLFPTASGHFIETVYIPEKERATACVSSQIGCKMGCGFCMTARQGFQGQLSAGEIINQIHSLPEKKSVSNIVYMGMGEPLDNLKNVLKSIQILTEDWGYNWSPKRITVSTIGITPVIAEFIEKTKVHLAISLHSPFAGERKKIMPVEKAYPLQELLDTLKNFDWSKQRRLSFEYLLIKNFNDSQRHVKALAGIVHGIKCRINLLSFHPVPGSSLQSPGKEEMIKFREALNAKGITATIRASRGQDIHAACGLLSTIEKNNTNL